MKEKRFNPKNFRNGDVIKVSCNEDRYEKVFVKFGENYYNLTAGGQMKACRYLPPGTKEILTNLSGMGRYFLMSEEELERETSDDPFGVATTDTDENGYWTTTTVTDFDYIQKILDQYSKELRGETPTISFQTDTTEEK